MSEKQPQPHQDDPSEPEKDRQKRDLPRVWVGSLADYNNGRLHGEWIDAAVPEAELAAAVQRMLDASEEPGAEEYAIFDYDNFGTFRVHEYERLDKVARVARGIAQHGPAFAGWAQLHDGDPTMLEQFGDCFIGSYRHPGEWGEEALRSVLEDPLADAVPERLRPYVQINCSQWARDVQFSGDVHFVPNPDGGVWVYWAR